MRKLCASLFPLTILGSAAAIHAVEIPVEYRITSWIDAGAPIAIATSPSNAGSVGVAQNFEDERKPAQSFTTVDAFTLDKIWIKYNTNNVKNDSFTLEIRLFEMTNPNATSLPVSPINLFSTAQTHNIPTGTPNNTIENYVVFDVENVALLANKGYAFMILTTDAGADDSFAYQWSNFNSSKYAGGSFFRGDRPLAEQNRGFDQIFALQYALPTATTAIVPEPATLTLAAAGLLLFQRRRHSTDAHTI